MDSPQKVLLVGGTGTLGREVTNVLYTSGHKVRIMMRAPEKVKNVFPEEVEIMKGDLIDANSIRRSTEGVDVVIASAHALLGKGKYASEKVDLNGHKILIDTAKKPGFVDLFTSPLSGQVGKPPWIFGGRNIRWKNT